ncbi:hypothetical protein I3760_15G101000 [Carya illinoinensis]|nr:hypothetical protein I3760_15G101000 [Carya illinoinensis]
MEQMNQALLAKAGWELSGLRNGLWHSILSSNYVQNTTFWLTSPKSLDSLMWKGILKTKELLSKGRCFQIFNGRLVNIWSDPWILTLKDFKPTLNLNMESSHQSIKVSDIILNNPKSWDIHKMKNLFDQTSITEILKIPLTTRVQDEDKEVWSLNHSGKYSVKQFIRRL